MQSREAILHDRLSTLLFRMSVPGVLSMLVISLNSFVDAVYAGRLIGQDALAGVSLCIPLMVINSAVTGFISSGASNVLSRAVGSGNTGVTQQIFAYVLIYSVVVSLVLGTAGYFLAESALKLIGAEHGVLKEGAAYYRWMMTGCFTSIFGLACSSLLRAEGQMKLSMRMTIAGVICNIILNPILIYYCNWGVKGAALATVLSMAVYSLGILKFLNSNRSSVKLDLRQIKLDKEVLKEITEIGSSAMVMQASSFVRQLVLFKMVTLYSDRFEEAFFSAVFRIYSFSLIPVFGILQALQPVIGINFGAGKYERSMEALKIFRLSCCLVMLLVLIPVQVFPKQMLSLILPNSDFTHDDLFHFRLMMGILIIAPVSSTGIVFLQATGNGKISASLALGRETLLFIPLLLSAPHFLGKQGIYLGLFTENVLYMLIVLFVVRRQMIKIKLRNNHAKLETSNPLLN
ncbi:MATE family efflux transporter [Desertivirga brevis]|uniref:MATE family efflux transporter n=1 Tax=Desertivirga brevis TaxID=2810310 RepID=UPI001A96DBD1|nr:MATE family efflux transporter [Pedobacter sp. SYSU D00873]